MRREPGPVREAAKAMEQIKALLSEMRSDEYVRFKYGKQIDAALKALDKAPVETQVLEARLLEMLELVRGKKGGSSASPQAKSKRAPAKPQAVAAHG